MVLRYSNSNTCVRSDNLDLIEQALTRVFEQEGYRRIPKPPLPQNPLPVMKKLRSLPWEIERYLGVIGLFVGRLGWTIVNTSPSKLLCRRARGAIRPRLSELAMQIGCDAFHYMVHDSMWGALLEADAAGQTFASGYLDCYDVKDMRFYDEPITEQTGGPDFFLLNVPEELQAAARVCIDYEERQKRRQELAAFFQQIKQENLEALSQQQKEQVFKAESEWEELDKSSFEIVDEALGQTLLGSSRYWEYWHLYNLLYKAYAEPQQLEVDGALLLYFQSAKKPDVQEIWEAMSNEADTDTDSYFDNIPFVRPVDAKTVTLGLQDFWEYEANRPRVGWEWRKF